MAENKFSSRAPGKDAGLFRTPFSGKYWQLAAAEFRDTRMLIFAALMIALRVVFKAIRIPVGPYLDINTAFVVNALGAMCFGPVVAIAAAAVTDTLGCLLFPTGAYFFPFIFIEIAGSVIFALMLYRTEITPGRVILSRFLIDFGVNIVLQTPIMAWYYQIVLGKYYALVDLPRIIKNLVLFPLEAAVLMVLLRAALPPLSRMGFVKSRIRGLDMTKKTVVLLVVLTLVSAAAVAGYSLYSYNTTSLSEKYTAEERLRRNEELNAAVLEKHPEWDAENTVTIIGSAIPRFGSPELTYTVSIYEADTEAINARAAEGGKDMTAVRGYSRTPASKDEALTLRGEAEIVINGESGEVVRYTETAP